MTADADAVVIIPGAEESCESVQLEPGPVRPGARVHLSTSKNTKLQLTSLAGRAILSCCLSPLRGNERPAGRGGEGRNDRGGDDADNLLSWRAC